MTLTPAESEAIRTPAEAEVIRTYVTQSLREYKGFPLPDIQHAAGSEPGVAHIVTGWGEIKNNDYDNDADGVPHNLNDFPQRPDPQNFERFEDFESAWVQWKNKAAMFTSYYRLPRSMGHELYLPSPAGNVSTKADPWDATLIPVQPRPEDYTTYEAFRSATQKWVVEVSESGFLPPHASEIEDALMVKMSAERKSDVAELSEVLSAEPEGFNELFRKKENERFHISQCVFDVERRKCSVESKFVRELCSGIAQAKLERLFIPPEDRCTNTQEMLTVQGYGISLNNILSGEIKSIEEKTAKDELRFRVNKASPIFDIIVDAVHSAEKDMTKCSSRKDENVALAINIIQTEKPAFSALYKLLFLPIGINDFNAVLDSQVGGVTIKQMFLECLYSSNIIWFFQFATQTVCPYTLRKLSSFAHEVLVHHGKTVISQFILGDKNLSQQDMLEVLYGAAKLLGLGRYDVFHMDFNQINKLKSTIKCSNLIETLLQIYYLNIIANSTSKDSNLKDLVKSAVTAMSQQDGEVSTFFSQLPDGMRVPELAPLCLFCIQQLIGLGDVQVLKYLQILKRYSTTDIIQRITMIDSDYSNYCATLVTEKVMLTKDCRCQLLEQLTAFDSLSSLRQLLNTRAPLHLITLLSGIVKFTIKNCMKVTSTDTFWKGFTGDYFFADVCLPILTEAVSNNNPTLIAGIVDIIKTLLKYSLKNDKLGKNCKNGSEKMESLEISSSNLENLLQIINKLLTDEKMRKYHSLKLFSNLMDCCRYIYSVYEQCVYLFETKPLFITVAISTMVYNAKEKILPSLLKSILALFTTVLKVLGDHPTREATPGTPLTAEETNEANKRQQFIDKFFSQIIRMKGKVMGNIKHWNYISFYTKESTLKHALVMLEYVRDLLEIAFTAKCPLVGQQLKKFLGETMFGETTALKMLMQQASNFDIKGRDQTSYRKGYNCITYPAVMGVAHVISVYQNNKKLVKKVPESKPQFIDVVSETGKADVDSRSLILTVSETQAVRAQFLTVNGKSVESFIVVE